MLGIAAMFIMPTFPGTDFLTSAAIGIVSGLAATGVNQTIRQMTGNSQPYGKRDPLRAALFYIHY